MGVGVGQRQAPATSDPSQHHGAGLELFSAGNHAPPPKLQHWPSTSCPQIYHDSFSRNTLAPGKTPPGSPRETPPTNSRDPSPPGPITHPLSASPGPPSHVWCEGAKAKTRRPRTTSCPYVSVLTVCLTSPQANSPHKCVVQPWSPPEPRRIARASGSLSARCRAVEGASSRSPGRSGTCPGFPVEKKNLASALRVCAT